MSQHYVYPAIFYYNQEENNYTVAFADLDIFTEGETIEDAYSSAKDFLYAYIKCSMHIYNDVDSPSSFEKVKAEHEKDLVMLVDVSV